MSNNTAGNRVPLAVPSSMVSELGQLRSSEAETIDVLDQAKSKLAAAEETLRTKSYSLIQNGNPISEETERAQAVVHVEQLRRARDEAQEVHDEHALRLADLEAAEGM